MQLSQHIRRKIKLRDTSRTKNKYEPKLSEINSEITYLIRQHKNTKTNSGNTHKTHTLWKHGQGNKRPTQTQTTP